MSRSLLLAALLVAIPAVAPAAAEVPSVAPQVTNERLAIATRIAARVLPEGSMRKIMAGTLNGVTNSVVNRMMDMPIKDLAGISGVDPEKLKTLGPGTAKDIMKIMDPAFETRMQITMKVMTSQLTELMVTFEPSMRDGMAEAYARRFSVDQLNDLERFFNSPTGSLYAQQVMEMGSDPAIMGRMQTFIPKMTQAMPAMMREVAAQTASLPKPRKAGDLTAAEKQKLAEMFGSNPKEAK